MASFLGFRVLLHDWNTKGCISDCLCTFWSWSQLSPYYLESGSIELFPSLCPLWRRYSHSESQLMWTSPVLSATEIDCEILILSYAFTPELSSVGIFDASKVACRVSSWSHGVMKWPLLQFLLERSDCLLHLFSLLVFFFSRYIGLCIGLWCGDFGQWLWAAANHPRGQTWQHPGWLCWLFTAGWTGKNNG